MRPNSLSKRSVILGALVLLVVSCAIGLAVVFTISDRSNEVDSRADTASVNLTIDIRSGNAAFTDSPNATFSLHLQHPQRSDRGYYINNLIYTYGHARDREPVSDEWCDRRETALARATGGDIYGRVSIVEPAEQADLFY